MAGGKPYNRDSRGRFCKEKAPHIDEEEVALSAAPAKRVRFRGDEEEPVTPGL
jgi:hypothetical protein